MKNSILLILPLFMFGCATHQVVEPKSVTLIYDQSKLTAEIQADDNFAAYVDNDKERIDLSGTVRNLHPDYLLDVEVIKASKVRHATNQISTSMLIKQEDLEKPIFIGGDYQYTAVVNEDNKVKSTESVSMMSVKLSQ